MGCLRLILQAGTTTLDLNSNTLNYSGATLDLTNLDTFTVTGSTVIFDGTTALTSASKSFNNVQIGSAIAGGSLTTNDNMNIDSNLTVLNGGATTFNIDSDTVNFAGNVNLTNLDTFTVTGSTAIFDGTTTLTSNSLAFNNVQVGTGATGGSLTTADNMDVDGTFTVLNGGATTFDISSDTVNFASTVNLTNLDTFTVTGSTAIFDGTTTLTSNSLAFNNVQIGTGATGGSLATADNMDVNGTFTVLNGGATTFDIDSDTVNFAGNVDLTNLDTFTVTGSTAIFDGTSDLTSNSLAFNNVQIGTATSSGSVTLQDDADIDGLLTFNTTGGTTTLDLNSNTLNYSGTSLDLTNLDTFTTTGSTFVFDAAAGTQTLNSDGKSFNNLTHSGAAILQIITNNLSVGGTLTNSAGTFDAMTLPSRLQVLPRSLVVLI